MPRRLTVRGMNNHDAMLDSEGLIMSEIVSRNGDDASGDECLQTGIHDLSKLSWKFTPPHQTLNTCKILIGIGAVSLAAGLIWTPQRLWAGVLLNSFYLLGLALGAMFLIATLYLTGARWGVALRRIPEAMAGLLPWAAFGIGLVIVVRPSLYPAFADPEEYAFVGFKAFWLNYRFFLVRAAIYIGIWLGFMIAILRNSRAQDRDGDLIHTRNNTALSAVFLVLFALTVWLASFDWIMSLEPRWFSTMFGVYNFAGLFSSAIACIIVIVVWLRRQGALRGIVTDDHLHDLGKLLLAFTTFWAYIWFCQYMLIWYANIPEETSYFIVRTSGSWGPLFVLNILLNWGVPFLALLPRGTKRNGDILVKIAVVVLMGRWLDLYLMIFPGVAVDGPMLGIPEIGLSLGAAGLFGLILVKGLGRWPLVPLRDPCLQVG